MELNIKHTIKKNPWKKSKKKNLSEVGLDKDFLDKRTEALSIKEVIDKLGLSRWKIYTFWKTVQRMKSQTADWKKCLQNISHNLTFVSRKHKESTKFNKRK